METLKNKIALITGASRGIGKATAEQFLNSGWKVIGTSTSGSGWEHQNINWIQLDLSDEKSIIKAIQEISKVSSVDVLINNSGIYVGEEDHVGASIEIPILRKILEVNLIGTINFTERAIPLINEGGHIISLGSGSGALSTVSSDDVPAYRISKVALSMYTRVLAIRLKNKNITVSIVDPGWTKTDMGGNEAPRDPREPAQEIFALATSKNQTGRFWKQGQERSW